MLKGVFVCLIAVICFVEIPAAGASAAGEFTLEVKDKPAPAEISEKIRKGLDGKAYLISDSDGPIVEFWFATEIPLKAKGKTAKESLDNIEPIALLGIAVIHREEHYDFRNDPFDPGTYTMRMGIQPQDGDHMGTAPFDTFAILLPHDREGELFEYGEPDHELLVDMSSEDTVTDHPPIFSLQPLEKAGGELPRLSTGGERGRVWQFLCLELPGKTGGENAPITVQIVFDGIGDL